MESNNPLQIFSHFIRAYHNQAMEEQNTFVRCEKHDENLDTCGKVPFLGILPALGWQG